MKQEKTIAEISLVMSHKNEERLHGYLEKSYEENKRLAKEIEDLKHRVNNASLFERIFKTW